MADDLSGPIPYSRASTTEQDALAAYRSILHHVGPAHMEPIRDFEAAFAAFVGTKYGIATSSCTGAIHLALAGLGVHRGDEVILADTNWVATVAPVVHAGAVPVFVDIDPETWCIDPSLVAEAVTARTRAIIVTHLYGNVADVGKVAEVAAAVGVPLIEDAAEAVGSRFNGRHVGSFGDVGVFSFHGTKTISTGEGGMLVTSDPDLQHRIRVLADHGREPENRRQFWPTVVGFKFKMAPVLAAVGLSQLSRVDDLIRERQTTLHHYREALEDPPAVTLNPQPPGVEHGAWMPTLRLDESVGFTNSTIVGALKSRHIDARTVFPPLSSTPPFRGLARFATPEATRFAQMAANLPSFPGMTPSERERVIAAVDACKS